MGRELHPFSSHGLAKELDLKLLRQVVPKIQDVVRVEKFSEASYEPHSLSTGHRTERTLLQRSKLNCGEGRGGRGTRKGEDHLSSRICIMQRITVRTQFHKCMQVGIGGVNMEGYISVNSPYMYPQPPDQGTLTVIGSRVNDIDKEFLYTCIYTSISEARHLHFSR